MGIFDAFSAKPAKKAAAENTQRLSDLGTQGFGYLDAGRAGALGALGGAQDYWSPLSSLATKYGGGSSLYLDSLGVNGAEGNQRAQGAFMAGPGYDWQMSQGLDALNRRRAAGGMINSGNADLDAIRFGQGLASTEYGRWQDRLGGFVSPELAATQGTAGGLSGLAGQEAGVWSTDAGNRVGLASTITGGINNQATQRANAEMAGSANLWGLGLNLANLGSGLAGKASGQGWKLF